MKYFLYNENVYRERDGKFYQKTGVFGEPEVKLPTKKYGTEAAPVFKIDITHVVAIKKNQANALINAWYKTVREKWTYQGERFKHLDYFTCFNDFAKLYILGKSDGSLPKLYHQGYVWDAWWSPNEEKFNLYKHNSKPHKRTALTNCAPVWNITQKCYV